MKSILLSLLLLLSGQAFGSDGTVVYDSFSEEETIGSSIDDPSIEESPTTPAIYDTEFDSSSFVED